MALTKEIIEDKIEIVGTYRTIQIRTKTLIKEDGAELSQSYSRHLLECATSSKSGDDWTHVNTDVSSESAEVQAIATAVWTASVVAAKKTWNEANQAG